MKLPVFFELDGKYAVMLPTAEGGVSIIKSTGSPNIADFMQSGFMIKLTDLPADFQEFVLRSEKENPNIYSL